MIRFSKWLLAVLALALVGLVTPVLAEEDKARDANTVKGKIQSVHVEHNQFTLTDSSGKDRTFQLARDAKIRLNDKESKVADLREGQEVTVTFRARARELASEAGKQAEIVRGQVKRVEADNNQLVLKDRDGKDWMLELTREARIRLDGKDSKLADLKEGQEICVVYAKQGDRLMVSTIQSDRPGQATQTIRGQILTIQADKHQFVLKDPQGHERRFELARDARVLRDNKESNVADLKQGEDVVVTYQRVATGIQSNR